MPEWTDETRYEQRGGRVYDLKTGRSCSITCGGSYCGGLTFVPPEYCDEENCTPNYCALEDVLAEEADNSGGYGNG